MKRPIRLITATLLLALVRLPVIAETSDPVLPHNSNLTGELFYRILVGELSALQGDRPTAFALLLDAARKANSDRLYQRAVELAIEAGDGESALKASKDWAKAFPTSPEANRYLLQILIELDRITQSVEPAKHTLATLTGPEQLRFIEQLPRLYARGADKKLAASAVEQVLASELGKASTGPSAWASVGYARLIAKDAPGALQAVRQGAALNPLAEEPMHLAVALSEPASSAAETMVLQFLNQQPSNPSIRLAYVRKLIDTQRYAQASAQLHQLNIDKPELADAWLLRGTLELVDNQLAEAEASFKAYVALATRSESLAPVPEMSRGLVQAYLQLAEIAEKNNHLEQANAYLQRIASPQDLVRVQSRRAMILARQGKMPEARELIRSLPEAQPSDASAKLMAEVQLLKEFKQFPAAYQLLSQALDGNRKDVELTYELATVAEKIGKFDEMETLLRQVLVIKPDYHAAYNALGYSLADRKIRLAEARQLIKKALEFAPEDPYIIDSLAWVEFRSGNSAEALRLLQKAFKARPDAEIAAHMGEVLWVQGEAAQAKAIWNQGKSLNPANETLLETMHRLSPPP